MKKIFLGAVAALSLAACSNDEVLEVNRTGDEIQFNVVANKATRAADVYCNNNMPTGFEVWASIGETAATAAPYITGDQIVKSGTAWENQSGVRYWPEGKVNFFGFVNDNSTFNDDITAPQFAGFEVAAKVDEQKDLLYAVNMGLSKAAEATSAAPVEMNFRHALSQVVFQAKNTNANLYVEIDGIKVCNVAGKGTYTLPFESTTGNVEVHDGNGTAATAGLGTWALDAANVDYEVTFDAVPVPGDSAVKSLTATNDASKEFSSKAMLLLPQTTPAWSNATDADNTNSTFFLVKCKIYNVAGDTFDASNDVLLWGDKQEAAVMTKYAAIPAALAWEQGKKYIYTFVFGQGGGFIPDPTEPDPDPTPDPVLVPITFTVTVDDFVAVTTPDIQMGEVK